MLKNAKSIFEDCLFNVTESVVEKQYIDQKNRHHTKIYHNDILVAERIIDSFGVKYISY